MDKVAIVTDSNSGITLDEAKRLGIRVVPMPFLIDGKTYYEEISLSQEEFFKRLEEDVDISTVFFFNSTKSNGMPFTKPTISVLRRYKAP